MMDTRAVVPPEVNPDCGLKTRGWPETEAALKNMVEAARRMRDQLSKRAGRGTDGPGI